ncbi:MAG: chemotaxis protein CheA [Campylobacterales bacterium]|nr:chemotaxis protein CheA [Campylobacterales bacterium]
MELGIAQIREYFLEEAEELFAKIDAVLLSAESEAMLTDADLDSLFRYYHTLKGNSATAELNESSAYAHKLESFLGVLKHNRPHSWNEPIALIIDASDVMKRITMGELEGTLGQEEIESIKTPPLKNLLNWSVEFAQTSSNKILAKQKENSQRTALKDGKKEQNTIKVDLNKIDFLMNSLGEVVITVSMLSQKLEEIQDESAKPQLREKIEVLQRQLKEMQDAAMSVRMVPIRQIYSKFPKQVRDLANALGKKVELVQIGDDVEIDKAITDGLADAFGHLIRNSLDHGIETPDERRESGKDEIAKIVMEASQQNGQIVIKIKDDGRGISPYKIAKSAIEKRLITEGEADSMSDEERIELIFRPGFSTAEQVTDISGRGVGMDVVRVNIQKLGGTIRIASELGKSTTIIMALPLTLAVMEGLGVKVGNKEFILPVASISETLQPQSEDIRKIGEGEREILSLRDEFLPIIRVYKLLGIKPQHERLEDGILLVVNFEEKRAALFVDGYMEQNHVAVKSIEKNFTKMIPFSAATVKADGSIGLIFDVGGLIDMQKQLEKKGVL